jgi:hypothetical protein
MRRLILACLWTVSWLGSAGADDRAATSGRDPAADGGKGAAAVSNTPSSAAAAGKTKSAADGGRVESAADGGRVKLRISKRSLATLGEDDALGREINAGVIGRETWRAELAQGIAKFLRQVRTEPAFSHGRFVGWRLLEVYARRSDVHVQVLRAGDTVLRVNGRSLEHPEDFKSVWDKLGEAHELVLDIDRAGHPSKLHYAIAQ